MELYITGIGQNLIVHDKSECKGKYCVIHNPSKHCMKKFPTHWREDRLLMERICPHGIGHPDPDDIAFKALKFGKTKVGKNNLKYEKIHGCDGCCSKHKEIS